MRMLSVATSPGNGEQRETHAGHSDLGLGARSQRNVPEHYATPKQVFKQTLRDVCKQSETGGCLIMLSPNTRLESMKACPRRKAGIRSFHSQNRARGQIAIQCNLGFNATRCPASHSNAKELRTPHLCKGTPCKHLQS